jgi:predicted RNA methylase
MTIILDPENSETNALFEIFPDWAGKSVLEIGSGDGRLTWRYADKVARVVGLEPDGDKFKAGLENHPNGFEHVEFLNMGLDEFCKHVTLREAKSVNHLSKETLQSPEGSFTPSRRPDGRVTSGEKFDLALLSWSL